MALLFITYEVVKSYLHKICSCGLAWNQKHSFQYLSSDMWRSVLASLVFPITCTMIVAQVLEHIIALQSLHFALVSIWRKKDEISLELCVQFRWDKLCMIMTAPKMQLNARWALKTNENGRTNETAFLLQRPTMIAMHIETSGRLATHRKSHNSFAAIGLYCSEWKKIIDGSNGAESK